MRTHRTKREHKTIHEGKRSRQNKFVQPHSDQILATSSFHTLFMSAHSTAHVEAQISRSKCLQQPDITQWITEDGGI